MSGDTAVGFTRTLRFKSESDSYRIHPPHFHSPQAQASPKTLTVKHANDLFFLFETLSLSVHSGPWVPGAARPSKNRDLLHRVQSVVGVLEWCLWRAVRPRPLLARGTVMGGKQVCIQTCRPCNDGGVTVTTQ